MKAFLQFLQRAFKYFRNTKRVWRRPPRASLLIIDRGTASPLDEMFAHHKPHIMEIRGESVNMLALFRALPKIHLGAVAYLEAYIDFVKPKLILSRTDNNHTLWQLKRRPNVTYQVALVQNGWRFPGTENSMAIGTGKRDYIDIFFSMGSATPYSFSFESHSGFTEIGSLYLNEIPHPQSEIKSKHQLLLVSIFRVKTSWEIQGLNDFIGFEKAVTKRHLPVSIICQSRVASDQISEENFYSVAIPQVDKKFLKRASTLSSYHWLKRGNILINDISTLGYEALAIGLRVGFISVQHRWREHSRFGKPLEFGEKGPFWTNDPSEEEVGRILDYLLNVSDEQWERDSGWIRDQLMVHDYGNTKIRAYVEGVLTDSLESK
jgi:surface carbohydrate biosynthesis protein